MEDSPSISEREEMMHQAEEGRKYRIAKEVLNEVLSEQKANVIHSLESSEFERDSEVISLVMYLRVLKVLADSIRTKIELGLLAEKELLADGD